MPQIIRRRVGRVRVVMEAGVSFVKSTSDVDAFGVCGGFADLLDFGGSIFSNFLGFFVAVDEDSSLKSMKMTSSFLEAAGAEELGDGRLIIVTGTGDFEGFFGFFLSFLDLRNSA